MVAIARGGDPGLHEGGEGEEGEEEDALAVLVELDDVLCGVDDGHV
mgnify:CR=1 FL=1